ncbi:hypothetical protein [Paenarthrobacter sp. 4246]|uniref:hypothetical protein n=1 Tax=Paenarthrobacter sp. 4246 TaxID=3156456 RepID=UPI00339494FD
MFDISTIELGGSGPELTSKKPRRFNEPAGFFSELPIRIELMTFSLRVKVIAYAKIGDIGALVTKK